MSKKTNKLNPAVGLGCATLFALPFAGVGVFMAWSLASILWLSWSAASWVEVPATITSVELQRTGDKKNSLRVVADYRYEYAGQAYESDRVGLSTMADNFGSYHRRLHDRLHAAWKAEKTVDCFVDPNDPTQALLDRRLRPVVVVYHVPFVLAFGGVGFGIIAAALYGMRKARRDDVISADSPDKPWLLRDEWREGVQREGNKEFYGVAFFAVLWNSIALPFAAIFLMSDDKKPWWLYLIVAIFPAVGVGFIGWLVKHWLRRRKYGASTLRLATMPGVVGGKLAGVILAPEAVRAADAVRVSLTCTRVVRRGKNSTTEVLWQDERDIAKFLDAGEPGSFGVPITFTIPSHAQPTDDDKRVAWTLKAMAELPGIDYAASFEVPVFRTEDSQENIDVELTALSEYESDKPLEALLAAEGILVEPQAALGSIRYFAPAGRHLGMAIPLTIMTLIVGGASLGLLWNSVWLIGGASLLVTLVMIAATLHTWLAESELIVADDHWTTRQAWRGLAGSPRTFETQYVRAIELRTTSTSQSGNNVQRYQDVVARLLGEPKPVKLLGSLRSAAAARKLVLDLRQRAGLNDLQELAADDRR
ncbi:DUF3592 domain-containing protein [Botrimarina mediterranea]|uniref:DUF3592 domain-containing protein n=1 Tax=Botrimarina mediterranea TaxID=2528022 RepID=A0A518KDX4_9BACT|nr:DUF3592 domain-containing protein [Botrimarina mediterranea]QDV75994.1 hypothetical protein Spa11_42180 [Botrimarina mediterranea]